MPNWEDARDYIWAQHLRANTPGDDHRTDAAVRMLITEDKVCFCFNIPCGSGRRTVTFSFTPYQLELLLDRARDARYLDAEEDA